MVQRIILNKKSVRNAHSTEQNEHREIRVMWPISDSSCSFRRPAGSHVFRRTQFGAQKILTIPTRTDSERGGEMLAQRIRVAQSRSQCNLLHRQIGELQQFLGGVQTLRQQPGARRHPHDLAEPALERARGGVGGLRKRRQRPVITEMLADSAGQRDDLVTLPGRSRQDGWSAVAAPGGHRTGVMHHQHVRLRRRQGLPGMFGE